MASRISGIEKILAEADKLRTSAAPLLLDLCRQTPPSSVNADIEPDLIWTHFQPYFIEICDASYYGDKRFAILIAFEAHAEPAFVSAIETADGRFIGVLSGTCVSFSFLPGLPKRDLHSVRAFQYKAERMRPG